MVRIIRKDGLARMSGVFAYAWFSESGSPALRARPPTPHAMPDRFHQSRPWATLRLPNGAFWSEKTDFLTMPRDPAGEQE